MCEHPPPPGVQYGGCGFITDSPPPSVDWTHEFECDENMDSAINKSGDSAPPADDPTPPADDPTPPADDSTPPADDPAPPADDSTPFIFPDPPPWWVMVGAWCTDKHRIDALIQSINSEHFNSLSVPE